MRKCNGYWSKEKCKEIAVLYSSRSEFNKKDGSAYVISRKNGWLDEICNHMIIVGNRMKRCIYAIEFLDNYVYIGLSYNAEKRFNDHLKDEIHNNSIVLKHFKEIGHKPILKKLTDYVDVNEASKMEIIKKDLYENNGWSILNRAKCGGTGGSKLKWNKEECIKEALKYNNRVEFWKKSGSACNSALANNWLNEICSHMEYLSNPKWTKENCLKESLKYKTRKEFWENKSGAYKASEENKWLEDICSHMENNGRLRTKNGNWNKENCQIEALKYKTKTEFTKKCSGAYLSSSRNGWIDEICSHMKKYSKNED